MQKDFIPQFTLFIDNSFLKYDVLIRNFKALNKVLNDLYHRPAYILNPQPNWCTFCEKKKSLCFLNLWFLNWMFV